MSKGEKKQVLLNFLAEHNLALPPAAIHRNLKLHERLHVSSSTVDNYLDELLEAGYVVRIDPKPLADKEVVELAKNADARAYYLITEKGMEAADVDPVE